MTLADQSAAAPPRRITVPLGPRAYDVLIGDGLIGEAGRLLAAVVRPRRALVVTDTVVADLHLSPLEAALAAAGFRTARTVVPAGEEAKSWPVLERVVAAILEAGLERDDVVVALGGGVVGDLAGFAAAIARRGMPFAQVPTTLLAQVDSSVGGKTGINTRHGKNLVGAFHQPILVVSDTAALATLPDRQRRAGYAEIAKIGLLGDAPFFERLERLGARALREGLAESIATAVAAKAGIVTRDERESGERALLNLGHTFGHAVEQVAGYDGRVVHGEAVALGLCLAFRFSAALGLCHENDAARVGRHIDSVGLPSTFGDVPVTLTMEGLTAAMAQDKKVKDGRIRFVLVRGIGEAFVADDVPAERLHAFLRCEGLAA
jgi:3-dehydroquinate synthase